MPEHEALLSPAHLEDLRRRAQLGKPIRRDTIERLIGRAYDERALMMAARFRHVLLPSVRLFRGIGRLIRGHPAGIRLPPVPMPLFAGSILPRRRRVNTGEPSASIGRDAVAQRRTSATSRPDCGACRLETEVESVPVGFRPMLPFGFPFYRLRQKWVCRGGRVGSTP
jgi:hypothetical protein